MKLSRLLVPALFLTSSGCEDPLKEAQLLEEPRVLGVRVATDSDQSSLVPGESATFEVLLAGPDGPIAALAAYRLCVAADTDRGVPYCAHEPFAEGMAELDGPIAFEVPGTLPSGSRLAVLGTACVEGEPELGDDPLGWNCSGGEPVLRFSFDAETAPDTGNANPDLTALEIRLDGEPVVLDDPETPASCATGAAEVAARSKHELAVELGEPARENGESMQLSHFSTAGLLDRQFTFFDVDQPLATSIEWNAPGLGQPVKHYLVIRDGRGGVSFASFSVCVL